MNTFNNVAKLSIPSMFIFISNPSNAFECPAGASNICAPAIVIESTVPNLLSMVAPGDAPIILRTTTFITSSWFDAIAPYGISSVGIHSDLGRIDPGPNDSKRNIAIMYASHKVLNSLMPQFSDDWDEMLRSVGLDPKDISTDLNFPQGVGNVAGVSIVNARVLDGMNQLGTDCNEFFPKPYADCTGYKPVNNAEELRDPARWQPDILTSGNGIFFSQQFVVPQFGRTQPFSYVSPTEIAPKPKKSYAINPVGKPLPSYINQAEEVLTAQVNLTDEQKLLAEFYDNKIISLGYSTLAASLHHGLSLEQFVQLDFLVNVAAYDTGITVWENKRKYDAVRPFSAIGYIYGDEMITAWGGPGKGTLNNVMASEWRPYLQSANHPEYPSASASFCRAHATSTLRYLNEYIGKNYDVANDLSFWVPNFLPPQFEVLDKQVGSSIIEPGWTPQSQTVLGWNTWDDFSDDCGISRLWAGVHFYDSIPAGQAIGASIGSNAYEWLKTYIDGTVDKSI